MSQYIEATLGGFIWATLYDREQLKRKLETVQAEIEAQAKAEAAKAERLRVSQANFDAFNIAALETGFLSGNIDRRIMANVLATSEEPIVAVANYANRALTDELVGLQKTPQGTFLFNGKAHKNLRDLEAAVLEYLTVSEIPHFRELVRGVLKGSPLVEPEIRRFELLKNKPSYDASKLTTEHTTAILALESY